MVKDVFLGRSKGSRVSRLLSFTLVVVLLLSLLASCAAPSSSETPKQALQNRIESVSVDRCDTVVECFVRWSFPSGYDKQKLREAENIISVWYYMPLDPVKVARDAADCFMELFYDHISFSNSEEYTDSLIQCLVLAIGDDYSIYRTAKQYSDYIGQMSGNLGGGSGGIGMTVLKNYKDGTVVVTRLIPDSPAEHAGVQVGDMLYSVEGTLLTKDNIDDLFTKIQGDIGAAVHLEMLRGEEVVPFEIVRAKIENTTVFSQKSLPEDKIAYIEVTSFKDNTDDFFIDAIQKAEANGAVGFIFDMRSNPGGYLDAVVNMLDYLVPIGTRICSYGTKQQTVKVFEAKNEHRISVPCVVICNEETASAGELFSAALRDYNDMGILSATVVGTSDSTYGKGIMQSSRPLTDGSVLTLTTAFYNPPCDENYHGVGVIPDVKCTNDEALETARAELLKLIEKN